jgi:tRNA (guanine9-N1)-methyltransferase
MERCPSTSDAASAAVSEQTKTDAAAASSSSTSGGFVRLSKQEKKARRAQLHIEKKQAWRQRRKEAQHAAVAERAAQLEAKLAAMSEAERAEHAAAELAERTRRYEEKVAQSARVDAALTGGLRVALDLSYGELMSSKERSSLARQLSRCWGANRRAAAPVSLHLAGLGTCPPACLPTGGEDVVAWKVHRVEADVAEAFPPEQLVFLSPDADEPLDTLDPSLVYVIGGLVDSSVQKRQSFEKAKSVGARVVRLPLKEHAAAANERLPLTLTAVLDILLALNSGADWPRALHGAVALRHTRAPT